MNHRPTTETRRAKTATGFQAALARLKALPGVLGITLNHSAYQDRYSAIYLTIYLDPRSHRMWEKGFSRVPRGMEWIDDQLYDITALNIAHEAKRDYTPDDLWHLTHSEILYDPKRMLRRLYERKAAALPKPSSANSYLFSAWWYFRLGADIWAERGDALQAHLMLNQGVTDLIQALFIVNGEFIPNEKAIIEESYRLPWRPDHWKLRLMRALSAASMTLDDVASRQQAIEELWLDIENYLVVNYVTMSPFAQPVFYELLYSLAERGYIPLHEWTIDLNILQRPPLSHITSVKDDMIYIDLDTLVRTTSDEILNWHREVIRV